VETGAFMTVPEWSGKVVLIYLATVSGGSPPCVAVAHAALESRGGRQFVIGSVPSHPQDWASDLRIEVAWDQVSHVLVFDSLDQYREKMAQAPAFWELQPGAKKVGFS
jgi:hypothetical protein